MFLVTFFHVAPPSRVTCTTPSSLPVYSTRGSTRDSAIAVICPKIEVTVGSVTVVPFGE